MSKLGTITHVDLLFPSEYLKAPDLRGRDVVVTIEDIDPRHELKCRQGKKFVSEKKPVVYMVGKKKKWILNKTNAKSIAKIHGTDLQKWIGKSVTIYPTTVDTGGQIHDCMRVREQAPKQTQSEPAHNQETEENFNYGPPAWDAEPAHDQETGEVLDGEP